MRYAELDELEARIAEGEARRNAHDPNLHEEAEEARAKATESADATSAVLQRRQDVDFAPAEELKKLYRDIARRIHPDLTTDDKERVRRNRVMVDANRAYEDGNEATLRAILEEWQGSPDSVEGEGVAAELVRAIRKIHQVRRRLADIAAEIGKLTGSDLYGLKEKVDMARAHGQDLLAQMAEQLKAQIRLARTRLDRVYSSQGRRVMDTAMNDRAIADEVLVCFSVQVRHCELRSKTNTIRLGEAATRRRRSDWVWRLESSRD